MSSSENALFYWETLPSFYKYNCNHFEFTTNYLGNAWEHSLNEHPNLPTDFTPEENENIALRLVSEQTTLLVKEVDDLRNEFRSNFDDLKMSIQNCIERAENKNLNEVKTHRNSASKLKKLDMKIDVIKMVELFNILNHVNVISFIGNHTGIAYSRKDFIKAL